MRSAVSLKGDPKFCGRKMLWFERRVLSILENIWYFPLRYEFEDRACRRFAWQGSLHYPQPKPMAHKEARWRNWRRSRASNGICREREILSYCSYYLAGKDSLPNSCDYLMLQIGVDILAFSYVLEGEFEWAIDDQPAKALKVGEAFDEPTVSLHWVAKNPAAKGKTRVVAAILTRGTPSR